MGGAFAMSFLAGRDGGMLIDIYVEPMLEPRLEPETFSGGVNTSARDRNMRRIAESMRFLGDRVVCSPAALAWLTRHVPVAK
jgi:hypothetical protein